MRQPEAALLAFLLTLAAMAPAQAAEPPLLAGEQLEPANPNDARMLSLMTRTAMNRYQKAGTPLPEALQPLDQPTRAAYQREDWDTAQRLIARVLAILTDQLVDEGLELATSLDVRLDRSLLAPDETLTVSLVPLFTLGKPLEARYTASFAIRDQTGATILEPEPITVATVTTHSLSVSGAKLEPGTYMLDYRLANAAGRKLANASRRFTVHADFTTRLEALTSALQALPPPETLSAKTAVATLQLLTDEIRAATHSYISSYALKAHPIVWHFRGWERDPSRAGIFRVDENLETAEQLLSAMQVGEDPIRSLSGTVRLAYRSTVDDALLPFGLHIPTELPPDGARLIVALHGANGDERSFMRRSLLTELAGTHGYLVATPSGRGPYGGWEDAAEADAVDVTRLVAELFSVDSAHTFLMGHSMGGQGTWYVGFRHPELYAALAPVAGTSKQRRGPIPFANAPDMPVLFSHGANDRTNPVQAARATARRAAEALSSFTYDEHPNAAHNDVVDLALPQILELFNNVSDAAPAQP
jgi:pimeloyl-ACP methyl ester carboxylesterase